jgi:recombination protein RecA
MASADDKGKALDLALAQIDKQFGKGSVMRLGEKPKQNIKTIPTGSIALDVALGVGGLPRGRVVEIYGPESSGKCVVAGTYIWTDRGLETVEELFESCGESATCTTRVTDVRTLNRRLVNENGHLEQVAALTHNNLKPVWRITLRSGRTVTATANHPLRVIDEHGYIVWREVENLREGDVLVSAKFGAYESGEGNDLCEDEAVLLGYLVAEGTLGTKHEIRFTNLDSEVSGEFTAIMERLYEAKVKNYYDKQFVVHDTKLRRHFAEKYDLDYVTAHGKKVPHCIRTAGPKLQAVFLSALFEGDGWIDPSSTIGFASASEQLASEVQLMLYGFGIPATLSAKWNAEYERNYWTVTINPSVAHRFLEEIGFRSQRRARQVEAHFRLSNHDPQFENIPNIAGLVKSLRNSCGGDREFDRIAGDLFRNGVALECSRQRLGKIVAWADRKPHLPQAARGVLEYLRFLVDSEYTYEAITEIADAGLQPTFDVMLPDTHSFLANGVLSHNTSLALHAIASVQAEGGVAAMIDAEHALDPIYAEAIGVNIDDLLVSQPDTGEQALEITDMLIRSGAVDLIVIDSVAALVPRAEIEGEMGDSHVGLQARLMSQALRKITGGLNNTGTTAIFINQLREKVGVMFGCVQYNSRVLLADGTNEKIGKIVNQKMDVEVLSYDPELDKVVPKKIVNWFDNGSAERFLQFTVAKSGGNGRAQLALTENHLVRTPGGYREAGELIAGDRVMLMETHRLGEQQWQVVLGGLMGDGALSPNTRDRNGVRFRMGHGEKQADYLAWKNSLLDNIAHSDSTNAKGAHFTDYTPLPELHEIYEAVYFGDGKKHFSWDYLKALTPLALAVWYMDDGSFTLRSKGVQRRTEGGTGRIEICVEAFSPGSRQRMVEYLRDHYGFDVKLMERGARKVNVLQFTTASTTKFQELIAPYVHESMAYKLLPRFQGQYAVVPQFSEPEQRLVPARVLDVHVKPKTRSMKKFDIEVEGSHNYFVDGVMVHNSPETTTGGRALKFYASVRLDIRRIETLKDGGEAVGNRTRVKVVKNKVGSPFRQAEFDILYGHGISKEGSLIDMGVEHGIVRKSGAWYTYEGDQLGQGKEKARLNLKENPDLALEIEKKIKEKLGVDAVEVPEDTSGSEEVPVDF